MNKVFILGPESSVQEASVSPVSPALGHPSPPCRGGPGAAIRPHTSVLCSENFYSLGLGCCLATGPTGRDMGGRRGSQILRWGRGHSHGWGGHRPVHAGTSGAVGVAGYSGEGPGWCPSSEGQREPGGRRAGPVALSGPEFAVSASGGSGSESAARLHPSDPGTAQQRDSEPGTPGPVSLVAPAPPPKAASLSPGTGGGQAGLT